MNKLTKARLREYAWAAAITVAIWFVILLGLAWMDGAL